MSKFEDWYAWETEDRISVHPSRSKQDCKAAWFAALRWVFVYILNKDCSQVDLDKKVIDVYKVLKRELEER